VVVSARDLFVERGYVATTIAAVAERAGVSADTIYSTLGSKSALLHEVLDQVIGGDDEPVPLLERSGPAAVRAETDQRRQLTMFATGITDQLERVRPVDDMLRSAAAVDAGAAELRADLQLRQRKEAMRAVISWVAANGPLRDGLSAKDAAAILWTLTSPDVHRLLRDDSGWSRKRFESWLRQSLVESLLPEPEP
jgi:AcrR family transcriptional regulator